ncbi:hypothetical protein HER10_EVM0000822 [Colletotrichum scovillei]|uniref:uncharacterized protein n=1 Tax=Colletotrichum scovillei TaxID=1209932 RepID=UPI0015C37DEA|nr:uncharacterized protein HER10_EVM0000822 [Colletotrichum scovillei]KAF4773028.1 hypothetical protein HER10_EVM0000822 [Colletotrichum scovillei]
MPVQILRDAGANLAACSRRVRTYCHRLYLRILGRDGAPRQGEDVQQRGRVANPLVILVIEIFTTDFSVSRAMVAQLGFGFVYGVAVSALHLPLGPRTRLRTVLALAGVMPAAVYLFPGGPTLHVLPMIIISAAAGTEIQHNLLVRSRTWTADSVLRPQSSVECLLVAWLIAVGGNVKEASHFIQAGAVLCLDVLSSSVATRSLTRFFLRVVLVTLGLACLVQQFLPSSTPKNLDRRGWPRPEVLMVIGFFVTPGMAVLYKDVREVFIPRVYNWVFRRQKVQEDEENPAANGVLPVQDNQLPAWGDIEEELRAGIEQWMD